MIEGDRNMWGLGGKPELEANGLITTSFTEVAGCSLEGPARELMSRGLADRLEIGYIETNQKVIVRVHEIKAYGW